MASISGGGIQKLFSNSYTVLEKGTQGSLLCDGFKDGLLTKTFYKGCHTQLMRASESHWWGERVKVGWRWWIMGTEKPNRKWSFPSQEMRKWHGGKSMYRNWLLTISKQVRRACEVRLSEGWPGQGVCGVSTGFGVIDKSEFHSWLFQETALWPCSRDVLFLL